MIDKLTLQLLHFRMFNRTVSFIAYQQRRVMRRRLEDQLCKAGLYGDEVVQGPFLGLRYPPPEQWASCRFEKINGTYEHELHPLITRLVQEKHYRMIINVGAAEGFFSVGLAKVFPDAKLIAYEAKEENIAFCDNLARINQVADRVTTRGFCTAELLAAETPSAPVLVWMDIDTGERAVLDPVAVPWLRNADIVVELHDCLEPGLTELIRSRFVSTHEIEQITNSGLDYKNYPVLRNLLFTEIYALVGEDRRGLQDWFFMRPKSSPST